MNLIKNRLKQAFVDSEKFSYSGSNFEKYISSDGTIHIDLLHGNDINSNEVTTWRAESINGKKWKIYNTISGNSIEIAADDDKEVAKAILKFAKMY